MSFSAKILAASISPDGVPLHTFEITHPRYILAEVNTHRMLSKSSASSRAIPVEKMIKRVQEDPYIPTHWGKNQKGMQAVEEVSQELVEDATGIWLEQRDEAVKSALGLLRIGIHKQITNRLLEPFMWHTAILSGTEWSNFFHLRNNKDASPDFQTIARMMQELYESTVPEKLDYGEWHLPLVRKPEDHHALFDAGLAQVDNDDALLDEILVKVSVARCARVSYLTHDGKRDIQADLDLHDKLLASGHMSPFEHVARPEGDKVGDATEDRKKFSIGIDRKLGDGWYGNYRGWIPYRKLIPNEADILGTPDNAIKVPK